jgi:hypothetical protein
MAVDKIEWLPMEATVKHDTEAYMTALNASMDEFIGKQAPLYMSALRQAFMAGAMFQLQYKPQEKKT